MNDDLVVKNAKDIQRLDDNFMFQDAFNKRMARSHNLLAFGFGCLIAGIYILGCGFDTLKKRVDTIEGKFTEED